MKRARRARKRCAFVTGASSGIGEAIARRLAAEGTRVCVVDLDYAAAKSVAKAIDGLAIEADLSLSSAVERSIALAKEAFGNIDILVNNAGFQHVDPIENFPIDKWNQMLAVMLTAPFQLTKLVIPSMKNRKWGRIINIGSIHSLVASPLKVGYISAKHGLLGMTKTAALELGAYGITVNMICPAYVETPLVTRQIDGQAKSLGIPRSQVIEKVMLEPAAIKRLINPREVADFAAYLVSDSASAVTGAEFKIDLGWTAR